MGKKVVKLTESDLVRIVKRVISESNVISEATFNFTQGEGYGINKSNVNEFLNIASKFKNRSFFYNGFIFRLASYGENNDSKQINPSQPAHGLKWDISKPVISLDGYPMISYNSDDGYPASLRFRRGHRGLEASLYPKESGFSWERNSFRDNPGFKGKNIPKIAAEVFAEELKEIANKQKLLQFYGSNLDKFGEFKSLI